MARDGVCEGLTALPEAAAARAPIKSLALVRPDADDHVVVTGVNALGVMAYRVATRELPAAVRPGMPQRVLLSSGELDASPDGALEKRLRLTGFTEDLREAHAAREAVAIPFADGATPCVIVAGLRRPLESMNADGVVESLAAAVAELLEQTESPERQLARLRRLETAAGRLPALFRGLDVRDIFDRLSAMSNDILPHDVLALGVFSPDRTQVDVYAKSFDTRLPERGASPWPPSQLDGFLYRVIDDIAVHPIERTSRWVELGMRSSIRLGIWLDDDRLGVLNFSSRAAAAYGSADVAIGLHIASYVATAMSHQRLAESARVSEELRTRAARSDLLDELLATVTDSGELPAVFDRISTVSQKVLAHDALVLTAVLPSGTQARVYASKTPAGASFPDVVAVPPMMRANTDWEYDLVDDLQAQVDQAPLEATKRGYRSALRVPIRLDGEYAAGLSFLSMTPALYAPADVASARRIADRIALSFSRERGRALAQQADEATTRAAQLEARVRALTDELNARSGYHRVIGESASWRQVLTQATQVGPTETTVLLLGESGTGKEVIARFIHRASARSRGPFVAINCAALPEQLLESELFGYERGAFTGAAQAKAGQLEQAAGGTLFLDEIGEMSAPAQAKFLRVLQEREFLRLGGTRMLKADVRVIAATNRDLESAIQRGQFREDLYYRLNVFAIRLPALRDRRDDILPLSEAFLNDLSRALGRPPGGISQDARRALVEYHWPGNVRELRNILERAAILSEGGLIVTEHLGLRSLPAPAQDSGAAAPVRAAAPFKGGDLKSVERALVEKALLDARYNKSHAAKLLGVTRSQLYAKLRRHGLD